MILAVVPAFDEAATIGAVVRRVRAHLAVLVVDDGSSDGTAETAMLAGATAVVRHERRRGKAAALRSGFATALGWGASAVVTLDADGQHDPDDLGRFVAAARGHPQALVLGDRLAPVDGDPVPVLRRGAIRAADCGVGWIGGVFVRDTQCGYRLYPAALLREAALRREGFVLETELLLDAIRGGWPIVSVPVRRIYRGCRRSRFRSVVDGGRIAAYLGSEALGLLRLRLRTLRAPRPAAIQPRVSMEA
jgi:glycosyltransferase involved in cell wall biosynthesis